MFVSIINFQSGAAQTVLHQERPVLKHVLNESFLHLRDTSGELHVIDPLDVTSLDTFELAAAAQSAG